MFSQAVDSLIDKLKSTKYSSSLGTDSFETSVLSNYNRGELLAAKQAITEWLQDNHNNLAVENETLKQKLAICNEVISKSNFAPMLDALKGEG